MLNLSAKNIQLNGSAASKEEAIQLVAQGLVANGNVEAGYEKGMLARETQTSTFLGNGIAIPHGTLDTRPLVKETGVQIIQFPQGVQWGEGNVAYVAIGIAAKSDEHLTLLRQLTTVLSDEAAAEKLAKTQDVQEFADILSGKKSLPILSTDLITLNVDTSSLVTLSAINAAKLQEQGYVNPSFISDVLANQPLALGDSVFVVDSSKGNVANGLAVARCNQGNTLLTVSANDNALESVLARLLTADVRQQLRQANAEQIVALLSGNPIALQAVKNTEENANAETTLEATFVILNEHGLHARPSAVLVSEVKKYAAKIEVQNVDRNSPLVSAKSMMKIVSLGVTKGTSLRFVATGEDAQAALDGIKAAIEAGLGE